VLLAEKPRYECRDKTPKTTIKDQIPSEKVVGSKTHDLRILSEFDVWLPATKRDSRTRESNSA
jgi:hypothetical protein